MSLWTSCLWFHLFLVPCGMPRTLLSSGWDNRVCFSCIFIICVYIACNLLFYFFSRYSESESWYPRLRVESPIETCQTRKRNSKKIFENETSAKTVRRFSIGDNQSDVFDWGWSQSSDHSPRAEKGLPLTSIPLHGDSQFYRHNLLILYQVSLRLKLNFNSSPRLPWTFFFALL